MPNKPYFKSGLIGIRIEGKRKKGKRKKGKRKEGKPKNGKLKCSRKKKGNGKLGNLAIAFVHGSFCPVDYFVLCASIFIHCRPTYTRAEHAMPKSAAGSQSSPFPCTSLLWHASIVAASAASSPSTSNVVQSWRTLMSNKVFKSAVPQNLR